jgi:Flp pilus assembly pilin Flp
MPYLKLYAEYYYAKARKFVTGKQEGASMGEYAVLLAIVTIALIATIQAYGGAIKTLFVTAKTDISTAGTLP